jgi:hypothetical protein
MRGRFEIDRMTIHKFILNKQGVQGIWIYLAKVKAQSRLLFRRMNFRSPTAETL